MAMDGAPPSPGDTPGWLAPESVAFLELGSNCLGWSLQLFLAGLCVGLFAAYHASSAWRRDDPLKRKVLTAVVVLNTTQAALNLVEIVTWVSAQDRSTQGLAGVTMVDCLVVLPLGFIAAIAQTYLARRACLLMPKRWLRWSLMAGFALGITAAFVGAMLSFVYLVFLHNGTDAGSFTANSAMAISLAASAVVDVGITVALGLALSSQVKGFHRATDSLLKKIVLLSVRTAAYTSLVALAGAVITLVFPIGSPYEWLNVPFSTVLSSLYVLSILTTLSGTRALSRTREATDVVDLTGAAIAEMKGRSSGKLCPRMERLPSSFIASGDDREAADDGDSEV